MQRAIAKQAEAERERRAKVIYAEGGYEASTKLAEAATVLQKQSAASQLRYLQTLTKVGAEKNSTIVFPLPVDPSALGYTRTAPIKAFGCLPLGTALESVECRAENRSGYRRWRKAA